MLLCCTAHFAIHRGALPSLSFNLKIAITSLPQGGSSFRIELKCLRVDHHAVSFLRVSHRQFLIEYVFQNAARIPLPGVAIASGARLNVEESVSSSHRSIDHDLRRKRDL